MKNLNVAKTRELGLCVSCEICSVVCPEGAITMEIGSGQFLPSIDNAKCTDCGICLNLCPGIDIDPRGLRFEEQISASRFDGPCLESYTAHSNNPNIRKNSTSGGVITSLTAELMRNGEFDAAFVLPFDTFRGEPARLRATAEISEILNCAKSKYIPASVHDVIQALTNQPDLRYIVVATPCQIHGVKKFLQRRRLPEDNMLFLGLFCDRTLNFNIIRYFEDTYGRRKEKLAKFEFRTKEKHGWPGHSKICFDSGRELIVDRTVRMQLKGFFLLKRCLFCTDKLSSLADISFGDCYIGGKGDFYGKSSVIVRTQKGKKIFDEYSRLFSLEREGIEQIRKSQDLRGRKERLEYAKVFVKEHNLYPDADSDYEIDSHVGRRLSKLCQRIRWGQNYNISRIRSSLLLTRVARPAKTTIKAGVMGIAIMEGLLIRKSSRRGHMSKRSTPGNVIIIGAGLSNKGAQAMLFATMDEIRRRLPNRRIYLLQTRAFERDEAERRMYRLNILPWQGFKLPLLGFFGNLLTRGQTSKPLVNQIREVINDADFFIDISGYALASTAPCYNSVDHLINILIARKFSVPYYILPQSIGPFDYPRRCKIVLYPLMWVCLRYAERIFVRGEVGVRCVRNFTRNIDKTYDIVLHNREYNVANIYNKEVHFRDIRIEPGSVGVIPNYQVILRANPDEIYSTYSLLIKGLLDANKIVYILRYSDKDVSLAETMKGFYPDNTRVRLMRDDLNCIELESIIRQFDFVIGSRYHSIIQSYKNGVPALVIGWAAKYTQLLGDFNQLDYLIDIRKPIGKDEATSKLYKIVRNWSCERGKITDKMNSLAKGSIFNIFDKYRY